MITVFYKVHLYVELLIEEKMYLNEWKKHIQTSPIDQD